MATGQIQQITLLSQDYGPLLLEIHACMQNPSPQYIRKYSQDCCHSNTLTWQFLIMRINEKILNFLNVCGPFVIMRSVNFGTV